MNSILKFNLQMVFNKKVSLKILILNIFLLILNNHEVFAQKTIIDSRVADTSGMAADLALIEKKLGPLPDSIREGLTCLTVRYYGFDAQGQVDTTQLREGVLVIHQKVAEDLKTIFYELEKLRFPIAKVVPINRYGLNEDTTGWNDGASMADNNTSAFNYRYITHSTELSPHAFGTAIDFNPLFNPYEKYHHDGKFVEPADAFYDKSRPGTVIDGPVVHLFDQRGWVWGGRWNNPVDFQHFDLRSGRGKKHYLMKNSALKDWFRYGEKDNSISLYASVADKKNEQAEIVIYEEERAAFEAYFNLHGVTATYAFWRKKKARKLSELPEWSEWKDTSKIGAPHKPLLGLRVGIYVSPKNALVQYETICATDLESRLKAEGASVFRLSDSSESKKLHLVVSLDFETDTTMERMCDPTAYHGAAEECFFHTIYVPGAFQETDLKDSLQRLYFLNLLNGKDWEASVELGVLVQKYLHERSIIEAVSRQLPSWRDLKETCIKTDIDGIYCKNIARLNEEGCPWICVYIKNSVPHFWKRKKIAHLFCEKIAAACFQGILDYYSK